MSREREDRRLRMSFGLMLAVDLGAFFIGAVVAVLLGSSRRLRRASDWR